MPIKEDNNFSECNISQLFNTPFVFNPNFKVSQNFFRCTKEMCFPFQNTPRTQPISSEDFNELMNINFVKISPKGLCLITMAEANKFLRDKIPFTSAHA